MTGERVLIFGEDPDFVEFLLTHVLSPHGYLTQTAIDSQAGLKAAQEAPPDLILLTLDLRSISYTEVIEQLKVAGPPPIIGFAPEGMEAVALNAFRMGVRDVLVQPVEAEEIAATIARVLHHERLERERDWLVRKLAGSNKTLEQSLSETQTMYDIGKSISSSLDLQGVLAAVVQTAVDLIQAQESHLMLLSAEPDELYLRASGNLNAAPTSMYVRVEDTIARQVARTGEPLVLSSKEHASIKLDYRKASDQHDRFVRSLILVPLRIQNQNIGVLGVANVTCARHFSRDDVLVLSALADWSAIAIKNARLHTHTDQTLSRVLGEVSAAQYKTDLILQNISDGVFSVNMDYRITSMNPAVEHITGWKESELLGRRFDDVFVPKSNSRRLTNEQTVAGQAVLTQSPVSATERTILCKDNRRIQVLATATPLRTADASISGALITIRDIGPELRSDHLRQEVLQALQSQHLNLDPCTEEALQLVPIGTGSLESDCHPITLRPIISQAEKSVQRANPGISFQVKLAPNLPFVMGNEGKVELALLNLIDSALALGETEQTITISANATEDSVHVRVEGTGSDDTSVRRIYPQPAGNKQSENERLVSMWATPQIKLYIASKLIEALGGRVWAEGISERSTCFNFSLSKIEVQDVIQALAD